MMKPVVGYEGYEVNGVGDVRSLPRTVKRGKGTMRLQGKMMNATVYRRGYSTVILCKNGKSRRVYVRQLVAQAFLGPCPDGYVLRSKDGMRYNHHLDNLEYRRLVVR